MKIARYWEKAYAPAQLSPGKTIRVLGWGWSETSREEAKLRAQESAQRSAGWFETKVSHVGSYGYFDRPPREEIIREIHDSSGKTIASITRNSYGVQVLNTENLMFIDVDIPEQNAFSALGLKIKKLFGKSGDDPAKHVLWRIAETAKAHREYSFRLYRTSAGYRCILINQPMAATDPESQRLMDEFGADGLYQKLCRSQECYRARLTPKFWRCGAKRPPSRFPWDSPDKEQEYRGWQRVYEAKCQPFAVCRFIQQFGKQSGNEELQMLIALHDKLTQANEDMKLA